MNYLIIIQVKINSIILLSISKTLEMYNIYTETKIFYKSKKNTLNRIHLLKIFFF